MRACACAPVHVCARTLSLGTDSYCSYYPLPLQITITSPTPTINHRRLELLTSANTLQPVVRLLLTHPWRKEIEYEGLKIFQVVCFLLCRLFLLQHKTDIRTLYLWLLSSLRSYISVDKIFYFLQS